MSDCGLLDEQFLDTALEGLRQHCGLKAIDAVIISHMHGDHFLEAPHLREKWGAQIWALDNMVDKLEHLERFDYSAPIQAYGKKLVDGSSLEGVSVDRAVRPGESFEWEGHRFTVTGSIRSGCGRSRVGCLEARTNRNREPPSAELPDSPANPSHRNPHPEGPDGGANHP